MTTYNHEQLWFDEIATEGRFPRGALAMEVIFEDDSGEKYVWTPKWNEIQNLYATAERVEEINEGEGGEYLEQLKALQQFSGPTLTRLAECIDTHTSISGIEKTLNDSTVRGGEMADREHIDSIFEDAGLSEPDYPEEFTHSNRWKIIRDHLAELNGEDYQQIIDVIETLAHRNRHIDEEERRRTIIEELNKALTYENMEIGLDGIVRTIQARSDEENT